MLHERAAESIERHAKGTDEHAGLLSLHYMHAERYEDTWKHAVIAGDHASELYANAEAATYYRRATRPRRGPKNPVPGCRPRLGVAGDATERTGAYDDAAKAYAQARHLAGASTDRSRLLRKSGVVHERTARYRAALSCYTTRPRPRAREGRRTDRSHRALRAARDRVCRRALPPRETRRLPALGRDRGREAARIDYQPGLAHALYLQGIVLASLGRPSPAIAGRSLAIYEELGDLIGQGNALNNMGIEAYFRGRWSESLDLYERSAKARDQAGDVTGAATQQNNIAEVLSDQGHLARARELFVAAREVWTAAGYQIGVALATSNLGRVAGPAGDLDLGGRLLADRARGSGRLARWSISSRRTAG